MTKRLKRLHVICYKWGTAYPAEEVNILRAMVARNLTVPHDFYCITDDPTGLSPEIKVHRLPDFEFNGNWRKLYTFSPNFLGLDGEHVVSLDIDIVIVGNIDFLAEQPDKDFLIGRHTWSKTVRGHGAVYRLRVGSRTDIWEKFIADPTGSITMYRHEQSNLFGEQNWFERHFESFDYFPEGKIVSFKHHCGARAWKLFGHSGARYGLTTAFFGTAKVPEGAAIISFHGTPKPRDVMHKRHEYSRRAPFVAEHWRV
jgi:hypothetical protein